MPIDSICSGCGKTLRVNDEFVGRKARCPACGTVYVVSIPNAEVAESVPESSDQSATETTYAPSSVFQSPQMNPVADSWAAMANAQPSAEVAHPTNESLTPLAQPVSAAPLAAPIKRYFVRTPSSMVYGPSTAEVVLDWIREGRLDDTCHIREESSDKWLGIPAWQYQSRMQNNPMTNPVVSANQFGSIPVPATQSVGYSSAGNGAAVLVLGLLSWPLCVTIFGAIICAILAIVFAMTELKKIREGRSPSKDKTIVLIGLWLGIANLSIWCLLIFGLFLAVVLGP